MGIAALVLAFVSLVVLGMAFIFSVVPVLGPLLFVLSPVVAIVGITLAGVAMSRAHREGRSDVFGVVALVLNIVFLIPAILSGLTCGVCAGCYSAAMLNGQGSQSSSGGSYNSGGGYGSGVSQPAPATPDVAPPPIGTPTGAPTGPTTSPCVPLSDERLSITGDLSVTSYRWNRPSVGLACPGANVLNTGYPYALHVFCNQSEEPRTVDIAMTAQAPTPVDDPLLVLYDGERLPADVRQCRGFNDDDETSVNAVLEDVTIAPGGRVLVVATTFDGAEISLEEGGLYHLAVVPQP